MPRRNKPIVKGVAINFFYNKGNGAKDEFRQGTVDGVYRTKDRCVMFRIFDKNRNGYRSFHYGKMHMVNVG